jgi:hypothetical protein
MLAAGICLFLTASSSAQVISDATGADWMLLSATVPAPTSDSANRLEGELERLVATVDIQAVSQGRIRRGDVVGVQLPAGDMAYRVTRVQSFVPGITSIAAAASDGSGDMLAISVMPDGAVGIMHALGEQYQLVHGRAGSLHLVRVEDLNPDGLQCAVSDDERTDHLPLAPEAAGRSSSVHMWAMADAMAEWITIDLMIAYTANSAASAQDHPNGPIQAMIAQAMNLSQQALDNSGTFVNLRLVHTPEIDYDDSLAPPAGITPCTWHLRRLTASPSNNPWGPDYAGHMEEVHELRDEYGADLVALIGDFQFGGCAWIMGSTGGFPDAGFSIGRAEQVAGNYTLIHEIGHNMGNHHGRDQQGDPTSMAPPRGGLFPHSTGWRWTGLSGDSYASVMSYGQPGDVWWSRQFSNPDILHDGVPTGALEGGYGPADNARSMREIKLTIAGYRPTQVDPPVALINAPELVIELPSGGTATRTVSLGNSGVSDLTWHADVMLPVLAGRSSGAGAVVPREYLRSEELTLIGTAFMGIAPGDIGREAGPTIIHATGFETVDGFPAGQHTLLNGWGTSSYNQFLEISPENPSGGSQHLRFPANAPVSGSTSFITPYFGPWPTGAYEFEVDVSVSAIGGSHYWLRFAGGREVAGVAFANTGLIFALDAASGLYTDTGWTWEPGVYRRLTVSIDPADAMVRYSLDQEEIAARPIGDDTAIGRLIVQRSSSGGSEHIDLDNITYTSLYTGFEWLGIDRYSGVVSTGDGHEVVVNFDATDMAEGQYTAELVINTNDPAFTEVHLPVVLDVTGPVSDVGGATVLTTRLIGNHPNPARTHTTVEYELGQTSQVQLEVFSVTGQRVALLADEVLRAGRHEAALDTRDLASGVYFIRLRAGDMIETGRMLVIR